MKAIVKEQSHIVTDWSFVSAVSDDTTAPCRQVGVLFVLSCIESVRPEICKEE